MLAFLYMKRRPWALVILAVLHLLAPLGNLVISALWLKFPVFEYVRLGFTKYNLIQHWTMVTFPIIAAVAIYLCRRWSFALYLFCMGGMFVGSYNNYSHNPSDLILLKMIAVFAIDIVVIAYILLPAVRRIYFDPKIRWWETADRFHCEIPSVVKLQNISTESSEQKAPIQHQVEVSNVSKSGLFFKTKNRIEDATPVTIEFTYADRDYIFSGETILHANQAGKGYGLKINHSTKSSREIRKLTRVLREEGRLAAERKPTAQDGFPHWFRNLLKSGKGLVPDIQSRKNH